MLTICTQTQRKSSSVFQSKKNYHNHSTPLFPSESSMDRLFSLNNVSFISENEQEMISPFLHIHSATQSPHRSNNLLKDFFLNALQVLRHPIMKWFGETKALPISIGGVSSPSFKESLEAKCPVLVAMKIIRGCSRIPKPYP